MAYWGMAMSNINNPRRAKGFIKEARQGRPGSARGNCSTCPRLRTVPADGANERARRQNWLKGLESIVQDFPGDIDARAWLGGDLAKRDGRDRQPAGPRHVSTRCF